MDFSMHFHPQIIGERKQRTELTVSQKLQILDELKAGRRKTEIAREYFVDPSSISRIQRQEETIRGLAKRARVDVVKRHRKPKGIRTERALMAWYEYMRGQGVSVNGRVLLDKAIELSERLNDGFTPNASWIDRLKKRNEIYLHKSQDKSSPTAPPQNEITYTTNEVKLESLAGIPTWTEVGGDADEEEFISRLISEIQSDPSLDTLPTASEMKTEAEPAESTTPSTAEAVECVHKLRTYFSQNGFVPNLYLPSLEAMQSEIERHQASLS